MLRVSFEHVFLPSTAKRIMVKEDGKTNPTQRALILQGGGALGAYEAGALKSWCKRLVEKDKKDNRDGPLFDIVAGASMGAVNASLLVHRALHYFKQKQSHLESWEKSVADLCEFYGTISNIKPNEPMWWVNNIMLDNPMFSSFWLGWESVRKQLEKNYDRFFDYSVNGKKNDEVEKSKSKEQFEEMMAKSPLRKLYFYMLPDKWGIPATPETARKYYSYWNSLQLGTPKVIAPSMVQPDMKFLDPLQDTHVFARFDNDPLVKTMKKYWDYETNPGIKTNPGEPRLMVIAVDIEDCTTATTFDSFTEYTEYGSENQYRIDCPAGVTIEHVKASMSTALRYEYSHFEAKVKKDKNEFDDDTKTRYFWDGAYIANTPANEVIQRHRKYWEKQESIPDLELYIINLYPAVEPGIPAAPDTILDRQTDIGFHDRTRYGIRVAKMRSEYIDLISELRKLAQDNNLDDKVRKILDKKTGNKTANGKDKTYNDLVEGRFKIKRVVYAQRAEKSGTAIYGKAFDFSEDTIKSLIKEGEEAGRACYEESQKYEKGNIV